MLKPWFPGPRCVPGVNRMTEVTISEQMTRMTRRAIAIPFQFLCGGLLPTSSCRQRRDVVRKDEAQTLERKQAQLPKDGRVCRMFKTGNHRLKMCRENQREGRQSRATASQSCCLSRRPGRGRGGSLMSHTSIEITPNEFDS